jgi:hypothetical protein
MGAQHNTTTKPLNLSAGSGARSHVNVHDFYHRCLVILRCTAHALCSTPGGLRFKAGSQPWLEGLFDGSPGKFSVRADG